MNGTSRALLFTGGATVHGVHQLMVMMMMGRRRGAHQILAEDQCGRRWLQLLFGMQNRGSYGELVLMLWLMLSLLLEKAIILRRTYTRHILHTHTSIYKYYVNGD